jgi:hypothetical protein
MSAYRFFALALPAVALSCTAGCVSYAPNSPALTDLLKFYSAGHTGCLPADNVISNQTQPSGGFMWNAACGGKTYLCTSVGFKDSASISCAVVPP